MYDPEKIINEILKYTKFGNTRALSRHLELDTPQIFYDIRKGKTKKISPGLACLIIDKYPEINKKYLLTGEGALISDNQNKQIMKKEENFDPMRELVESLKDQIRMRDEKIRELELRLDKSPKKNQDFIND